MTVLVDKSTQLIVQGITGRMASWITEDIQAYGTEVVAGVVPGKGGRTQAGVPVFDFVEEAMAATNANTCLVLVPPHTAREAIVEAVDAGIKLVVYPGDGLPIHDAVRLAKLAEERKVVFVGPNTPGVISPGLAKVGFMPSACYARGVLGIVSKSGSLSYEVCWRLSRAGIGQSTVIGIGGDPVRGLPLGDALSLLENDDETDAVLVLGEIGGTEEYDLASRVGNGKPLAVFMVGRSAPHGRRLGHAGALITGHSDTYEVKVRALQQSGIPVAKTLNEIIPLVRRLIARGGGKEG